MAYDICGSIIPDCLKFGALNILEVFYLCTQSLVFCSSLCDFFLQALLVSRTFLGGSNQILTLSTKFIQICILLFKRLTIFLQSGSRLIEFGQQFSVFFFKVNFG